MLKIVSWNMNQKQDNWKYLLESDVDVALVQEAKEPPEDLYIAYDSNPMPKPNTHWRAIAAGVSNRVIFNPIPTQEAWRQ